MTDTTPASLRMNIPIRGNCNAASLLAPFGTTQVKFYTVCTYLFIGQLRRPWTTNARRWYSKGAPTNEMLLTNINSQNKIINIGPQEQLESHLVVLLCSLYAYELTATRLNV